jgi:NAD(P)-dependent dehydrogenase (short-subunit alcohol dehydrogenase family)
MSTVLVIGASRGIGLEFVRQYLAGGARVIATVRDDPARQQLQALGAQVLKVDVAQPASVSGLAWQLDGEAIDIALYVAGVMSRPSASNKAASRRSLASARVERETRWRRPT